MTVDNDYDIIVIREEIVSIFDSLMTFPCNLCNYVKLFFRSWGARNHANPIKFYRSLLAMMGIDGSIKISSTPFKFIHRFLNVIEELFGCHIDATRW